MGTHPDMPKLPLPDSGDDESQYGENAELTGSEEVFSMEEALQQGYLDDYGDFPSAGDGDVLQGRVLQITPNSLIVDFGYKSEGVVPLSQVPHVDGVCAYQPGDTIEVALERGGQPTPEGYVQLSFRKAFNAKAWETLEAAQRDNQILTAKVMSRTKGGLLVDVNGIESFLPGSQIDVRPVYNVETLLGQDIPVRVVKLNKRRGNVVVSRRMAIEEEVSARRTELLSHVKEGELVQGTVKSITDYGAFIDLGGVDGLLHVSDMSYGRLTHPSEILQEGQQLSLKVLKFDREKERISLGLKQLQADPWATAVERFPVGAKVIGRVVSVTDYGSFIELEPGIEGLIHISEMTWSRRMKHPSKIVKAGDTVESIVLEVKPKDKRISLGIKQLEADPWTTVDQRYAIGSVVEGRVRKLTDFGAFIEIEEGIDGLVHISDLSWTKHVKHPSELLKKGQTVKAVVLHIDGNQRRLSLGVKQLEPDAWEQFFATHYVGEVLKAKVARSAAFGVFVEVAPGVEALCHNSEIPPSARRSEKEGQPVLPLGEELEFKIIRMNPGEKKIGLSLKALQEEDEKSRLAKYQERAAAASTQLQSALQPEPAAEPPAEDAGGQTVAE